MAKDWIWLQNERPRRPLETFECSLSIANRTSRQPTLRFSLKLLEMLRWPEWIQIAISGSRLGFSFLSKPVTGSYQLTPLLQNARVDGKPIRGQVTLSGARKRMRALTNNRVLFLSGRYPLECEGGNDDKDIYFITFQLSACPVDLLGRPID